MFYFRDLSTLRLFLLQCAIFVDFTSDGLYLDPCESGWFTIEENANNSIILSCKNISSTERVWWFYQSLDFGNCGSLPTSCSVDITIFNVTRPKDTESNVILLTPATQTILSNSQLACKSDNTPRSNCSANVIYRASSVSCFAEFSQDQRNLIGHCSVNKFYTSRGNYSFVLLESNGTFSEVIDNAFYNTTTVTFIESSWIYYNATSQMKKKFPLSDGIYTYRILFYPSTGPVNATFTSSNVIKRPKQKPSVMCSPKIGEYLLEGQRTNCICSVPNLGQPSGRLILNHTYGNYGVNNLSMTIYNINRTYNGTIIKCELDWARDETDVSDLYTVLVAYGPDNLTMSNVGLINFNPIQKKSVNISCFASEAYPELHFHWNRLCTRSSDGHCSLIADPTLDGAMIICTVLNPVTNVSVQVNQTLEVHYPPLEKPVLQRTIFPSSSDKASGDDNGLYEGDTLILNCTVKGGNPINATNVTLSCQSPHHSQVVVTSTEISSIVIIQNVSEINHNDTCICTTQWKDTDYYTNIVDTNLIVFTKPSTPIIIPLSKDYPFIAGTCGNCTLKCNSTYPGRPPAAYTWSSITGGNIAIETQGWTTMSFVNVNRTHDGQNVTCWANNNFTANRQPIEAGTFKLEVYYTPTINIQPIATDNQCVIRESDNQCLVQEGDRVHFDCTADSNPPPAIFTWEKGGRNVTILNIASANRTTDHGIFKCFVQTGNPKNDSRLPLNNTFQLTVLVLYKPEVLNFNLNSANNSLVVNESSDVVMTCQSSGMPTSQMIIKKETNDDILSKVDKGKPSLQIKVTTVQYNLTNAQCEHTGVYRCQVNNDIQGTDWRNVSLFVLCEPRFLPGSLQPNLITFRGEPILATFEFIAFPKIQTVYTSKLGNNCTHMYPLETTFFWTCDETKVPYKSVCRFLITNATTCDAGSYQLTFANGIGQLNVTLRLQVMPQHSPLCENNDLGAGAGAGITLAVVAVVVAIVIAILRHHRWVLPCSDTNIKSYRNTELPESTSFSKIHSRDVDEINRTIADENTIAVLEADAHLGSTYDSLKVEEIAVVSEYESIRQQKSNNQKHIGQPCAKPTPNRVYANIPLKEMPC